MIISVLYINPANAQWVTANEQEDPVGATPVATRCIGNDILQDGADVFRVSVWSDLNLQPGLHWEVDYQGTTWIASTTYQNTNSIIDPDVSLTTEGGDIYALVAYHDFSANEYYLDVFTWQNNGGTWEFGISSSYNFYSGTLITTMNMDADGYGGFVITLDDNSSVYVVTGGVSGGAATFNNGGSAVLIADGSYPDVCVYNDGNSNVVHLTYVEISGSNLDNLIINLHNQIYLAAGNSTPDLQTSIPPQTTAYDFHNPRIACPAPGVGNKYDCTVVTEESDGVDYFIVGFNDANPTTRIFYNDGALPPLDNLVSQSNHLPVVAYDNQDQVWVGWIYKGIDAPTSPFNAIFPISLRCDFDAQINLTDYLIVPRNLQNDDQVVLLSLAGRNGDDAIYVTTYNFIYQFWDSDEIYNKTITPSFGATSFRTSDAGAALNTQDQSEYSNLNKFLGARIMVSVFDAFGRNVLSDHFEFNSMGDWNNRFSGKLRTNTLYLFRIESANETIVFKLMIY